MPEFCYENLNFIKERGYLFKNKLKETDRDVIFKGLQTILSETFRDKIWNMIYKRYKIYENL